MGVRVAKWVHRTVKREQAAERKLQSLKLTPEQRLERLNARGFTASKERAKLIPLTVRSKAIQAHKTNLNS